MTDRKAPATYSSSVAVDFRTWSKAFDPVLLRSSILVSCLLFIGTASAQIFSITDGAISTCSGAIVDSGGQGGPGYGNNENIISTICPDAPNGNIALNFVTFNLSAAGAAPVDRLIVFDGASTAAPIMGTYSGNQLQGQVLFASPTNLSGCITLQFISNETGTGAFAASITCTTPCVPPTASATVGSPVPVLACAGESFTFDGSASAASAGFSIASMQWNFDDGTTAAGNQVEHSFPDPGEYLVQLTVTDNNGCTNNNQVDLQVLVGTTPVFTGTTQSQSVCQGATVNLVGLATAVTWSATPVADFGEGVYLPDDVGQTFTSQLNFTQFTPGATLTNVNDLLGICANMEHSFMGDLVISITCPNNQSVVMHQQNGGGTDLGIPVTGDGANPQPGTCWDYCWSPTATLGTWAQSSANGATPNVMPNGNGQSLIPGMYSSLNSLNGLLGCPLNGNWTISFTDLWAIDNGFLCSWNMDFSPGLYPTLTEFTPVIGTTMDSLSWTGPGVVQDPAIPNQASAVFPDPGSYAMVYSVIDNFGCTFDTTITITVTPAPVVELTSTLGATCNDPAQMHATIVAYPPPLLSCDFTLVLNDSFDGIWQGGAHISVVVNGASTPYTMTAGGPSVFTIPIPPGATISLVYTAGAQFNGENSYTFIGPSGNILYSSPNGPLSGTPWNGTANCQGTIGPVTYVWSPAGGVDDPTVAEPFTQITTPTLFQVAVYPTGQPWCTTNDTLTVLPPSFLDNDSVITHVLCNGGQGSVGIATFGFGGPWNYAWTDAAGQTVRNTTASNGDVLVAVAGTYEVVITEGPAGNNCTDTVIATILEPERLLWTSISADTLICVNGTALLNAAAEGGTVPVSLQWSGGLNGNGPHSVLPSTSQQYSVQAIDANGCSTPVRSVMVQVRNLITFDLFEDFEQCSGVPFTLAVNGLSGGDGAYSYNWNNGSAPLSSMEIAYSADHTVCVVVNDGCETPAVTSCTDITILHTPPLVLTVDTAFGCAPFQVQLALLDTTNGAQIRWNFGDGVIGIGPDRINHLYGIGGNYSVNTTVLWPNGCTTDTTIANMVRVISVPVADFTWDPFPLTIFEPTAVFRELAAPNEVSYSWDFFEFGTSDERAPEVTFPNDLGRSYPVQLTVANEFGCVDSVLIDVLVEDVLLVYVPNAFSPDGDGINEEFLVLGNDISTGEFDLRVFDRWGQEVFGTADRSIGWNGGLQNGDPLPIGVYSYRLKVRSRHTLQKRIILGHVTLLR